MFFEGVGQREINADEEGEGGCIRDAAGTVCTALYKALQYFLSDPLIFCFIMMVGIIEFGTLFTEISLSPCLDTDPFILIQIEAADRATVIQ